MFNVTRHQRNTNQTHNETALRTRHRYSKEDSQNQEAGPVHKSLASMRNCIPIPGAYINLDAGICICNPSTHTTRWELETGQCIKGGKPANPA